MLEYFLLSSRIKSDNEGLRAGELINVKSPRLGESKSGPPA